MAYVFQGKDCCVYDDNKINYFKTKLVLEDEEFQKNRYSVNYICKIDNIETPSSLNSE